MTFQDILKNAKKEWGDDITDIKSRTSKIPLSAPFLNFSLYGGIPRNKITEFFGVPSGGKSTSAVDVCKTAYTLFQKEFEDEVDEIKAKVSSGDKKANIYLQDMMERGPKKIVYFDLEHSFDDEWSKVLGISSDEITIIQPPDVAGEEILQMVEDSVCTGEIGLVVLDSIPSLVPRMVLDKKYGERTVASLAGLLTVFCQKMIPLLTRYDCTMLVINQIRDNLDNPYVKNTPGGRALKFYCSLRVEFRQGHPVDFLGNELPMNTDNPAGYIIQTRIEKQKSAPNNRKCASYYLMCDKGIVPMFDYAKLAIEKYGIITKAGAWYTLCDPETGEIMERDGKPIRLQGLSKVYQYLETDDDYYNKLKNFILKDIDESNGGN